MKFYSPKLCRDTLPKVTTLYHDTVLENKISLNRLVSSIWLMICRSAKQASQIKIDCARDFLRLRQFWKILKTLVQLILNSTRSHGITCLSIKGKIYTKENHARSLFLHCQKSRKQRSFQQSVSANRKTTKCF